MSTIEKALDKLEKEEPTAANGGSIPDSQGDGSLEPADDVGRASSRLARIDLAKLDSQGFVTPQNSRSAMAEQYRRLKFSLFLKIKSEKTQGSQSANVIVITSAIPGEGKTTVALNLAMSVAMELDRTVLLVDGDLAKPRLSGVLNVQAGRGLVDYLADNGVGLPDVLIRTEVPNLTFLPSGRAHPNPSELLASGFMQQLADELGQRYADRVVIFDSPPVLSHSGALALANIAGQIVFVVEAVRTPKHAVNEALRALDKTEKVSFVINKNRGRVGAGYAYGYGKDVGYGGGAEQSAQ